MIKAIKALIAHSCEGCIENAAEQCDTRRQQAKFLGLDSCLDKDIIYIEEKNLEGLKVSELLERIKETEAKLLEYTEALNKLQVGEDK